MDSKDFRNVCMAAGGVALTAAGAATMYASGGMPAALDLSIDATQVATTIAAGVISGGMGLALLGLTPLAIKYGYKFIQLVKQKLQEKYHMSTKEADRAVSKAMSSQAKSSSKGHMKDNMKMGYNRGAPINNPPRRSARNQTRSMSNMAIANRQSIR